LHNLPLGGRGHVARQANSAFVGPAAGFARAADRRYNERMATSTLLERMVAPISRALTPEAAEEIVNLRIDEETQQRIDELADKCNEGTLSHDERAEYQEFVSYFNLLTVLQARARTFLDGRNGE
jgi:hypothetical protein